jgi:hypothetical protein
MNLDYKYIVENIIILIAAAGILGALAWAKKRFMDLNALFTKIRDLEIYTGYVNTNEYAEKQRESRKSKRSFIRKSNS